MMFLNAWRYIEQDLGGTGQASPFSVDRIVAVFEVLISFHFINSVTNATDAKKISLKFNYRAGNIIGLVVPRVFSALSQLFQMIGL